MLASACGDDGAREPVETDTPAATADAGAMPGDDAVTIPGDASTRPDPNEDVDAGGVEIRDMLETVMVESPGEDVEGDTDPSGSAPIALFRDGSACRDLDFVFVTGGDAPAHRAANPDAWTSWKLEDSKVALGSGRELRTLSDQRRYPALAAGSMLDGAFTPLAMGDDGDSVVPGVTRSPLAFAASGRFGQGSSGDAEAAPPDRQGSYEIDGYRILFRYDDGGTATTTIVYDPEQPDVLFLGGRPFIEAS